jgi:hexokinase
MKLALENQGMNINIIPFENRERIAEIFTEAAAGRFTPELAAISSLYTRDAARFEALAKAPMIINTINQLTAGGVHLDGELIETLHKYKNELKEGITRTISKGFTFTNPNSQDFLVEATGRFNSE